MANHGVFVTERGTAVNAPVQVPSGIPFIVGSAPVQAADNPATAGVPVLCTDWDAAVEAFGYSDDWENYTLCEAMYSHFRLYGMQPIVLVNVLDVTTMKNAVAAADKAVTNHQVALPIAAINDNALVVKDNSTTLVLDTDYTVYYSGESCIVELISTSTHYSAASLNIAYNAVTPTSVNAAAVIAGIEKVELCMSTLGVIPDLLLAPGFSDTATVAAALAAKAAAINGMFKAKAIVDIPISATTAAAAITAKGTNGLTDENMIVCWPAVKLGDKTFHMSTQMAGVIAATDAENGAPHGSPSNNAIHAGALVVTGGAEVLLSLADANNLNAQGIVTALNFMGNFVAWGNYTACYPGNTDVKDCFIPVSRMFDWVSNSLIIAFWSRLDTPMTRRSVDSIVDTANIWLNGLTGSGYILGGRVEMVASENPPANLMQGIIKFHVYITPPVPEQEIDFSIEYSVEYLEAAFA